MITPWLAGRIHRQLLQLRISVFDNCETNQPPTIKVKTSSSFRWSTDQKTQLCQRELDQISCFNTVAPDLLDMSEPFLYPPNYHPLYLSLNRCAFWRNPYFFRTKSPVSSQADPSIHPSTMANILPTYTHTTTLLHPLNTCRLAEKSARCRGACRFHSIPPIPSHFIPSIPFICPPPLAGLARPV